ncbi:MAG: FKBP-type peptidyl-prolyl cis-trans isomerase [Lachnospiraceae bacterium]|nr:FKBP-type peptidyl-prolyl cis-trans isomerase [Lachnospiraceae bacterium]
MKRPIVFLLLICLVLGLTACGKSNEANTDTSGSNASESASAGDENSAQQDLNDVKPVTPEIALAEDGSNALEYYAQFVEVNDYKGIAYTPVTVEVTDADVKDYVNSFLQEKATKNQIKDRAVKEGDDVCMYYEGHLASDDTQFDGGTGTIDSLVIGSGSFIPGFEEQVVGQMPGTDFDVKVTFPEAYRPEGSAGSELNGAEAVFHCNVQYISETILPDYTDAYIAENTEYENIAAFETNARAELREQKLADAEKEKQNEIFTTLVNNCNLKAVPQDTYDAYYNFQYDLYEKSAKDSGMEFEEFVNSYLGATLDSFKAYLDSYAIGTSGQVVLFRTIAAKEGFTVSDEEYNEGLDAAYAQMATAYESKEDLEKIYGQILKDNILLRKTMQFVLDNAVEK